MTAEMACGPGNLYPLVHGLPLGVPQASRAIHQNHGVRFGAHLDAAGRLSAAGPGPREVLAGMQTPLAMPAPHVYRVAGLAGRASTVGPGHLLTSSGIIEIIWQL